MRTLARYGAPRQRLTTPSNFARSLQPPFPSCSPPPSLQLLQVYLSVDALVNRGSLDLIGALLEANSVLDSLSPDGQKARKARQQAELQAAGAGQFRQITR